MKEKKVRARLKKMTMVVVIISIIIFAGGSMILTALNKMLDSTMNTRMIDETNEYRSSIQQKLKADMQTLYTLSSFFEFSSSMNKEAFARGLYESNNKNSFIRMGYFAKDGNGIRVMANRNKNIEMDVRVEELNISVQEMIRTAWTGKSAVSKIYFDRQLGQKVFAYGVPVYKEGEVVGMLAASTSVQVFSEILDDETALNGRGCVRLIGQEGAFLIPTSQKYVQQDAADIYEGGYFSEEEEKKVRKALKNGEELFTRLIYNNEEYEVFIKPVGVQGWNLFCVETAQGWGGTMFQMLIVTRITFSIIILLAGFLILYGYRLLWKNNRQLIKIAYHDPLTGAYNTVRLMQELEEIFGKDVNYCVIAMNIRQFKFINEIFGREQADRLLCHIKGVLSRNMGEKEYFCRDSADMFLMLMRGKEREKIQERIEKIRAEITRFALSEHHNYQIMLYCGASFITEEMPEEDSATMLITHTMFALQKARQLHQNSIWFYDQELHEKEKLQNYVESHMYQALQDGEFKLFLQPKIKLEENEIRGAEALVRWIRPDGSMVYPDQFIPVFENNGFCARLDMYMMELVCRQMREWMDKGIRPVPVSVNQSKLLFYEADYADNLKALTEKYDIPPEWITLEILEGMALGNVDELNRIIKRLKNCGFRISMDDFGSGYSSLNTLGNLEIDELKFDRLFLAEISGGNNKRQEVVMAQIVKLTKRLGISTVVEGVETEENVCLIRELECDYGQGYYYSRPINAEAFSEKYMVRSERWFIDDNNGK